MAKAQFHKHQRVYVKPVDLGQSKYTLSAEEQQSLSQAIKRVPKLD